MSGVFDNMAMLFETLKASDILAEDVKLDVDDSSYFDVTEVGVLSSVRDDGDSEGVVGRFANGERNTIHGDASLVDGEITLACHLSIQLILEGEVGRSVGIPHANALGGLIHMSLYDVAIQAAIHYHRTLHVYFVSYLEQT